LSGLILQGNEEEARGLVAQAIERGAVRYAVTTGRRMLTEAHDSLASLEATPYKDSLESLCVTLDTMIAPMADA
jgi:hypothetical protein